MMNDNQNQNKPGYGTLEQAILTLIDAYNDGALIRVEIIPADRSDSYYIATKKGSEK